MLVMGPSKNLITPFLVSLSLLHIGVFFYFCICVCICIGLFSASRRQSSLGTTLPTSSWCRPSVSCPEFLANKGKLSGGKLPAVSHRSSKVYSRRILLILQRFLVTIISLPSTWSQVAQLSHLTYPFPPPIKSSLLHPGVLPPPTHQLFQSNRLASTFSPFQGLQGGEPIQFPDFWPKLCLRPCQLLAYGKGLEQLIRGQFTRRHYYLHLRIITWANLN